MSYAGDMVLCALGFLGRAHIDTETGCLWRTPACRHRVPVYSTSMRPVQLTPGRSHCNIGGADQA